MSTREIADRIIELSISEQTKLYNKLAATMTDEGHPVSYVKKFSDKPTCYKRLLVLVSSAQTHGIDLDPIFFPEGRAKKTAPVETAPVETAPVETAPVETAPVETAPVETAPVETAPVERKSASTPIAIDDSEIKVPAPKAPRTHKAPVEKKVTKSSLIRAAFENSGLEGIHVDALVEASGYDLKNAVVAMGILKDAKRTKNPISFVKVGKVYFRSEYAPLGSTPNAVQ